MRSPPTLPDPPSRRDPGEVEKALMEYLRVYVMIWQKIDIIWGMFITTYVPLLGFIHLYQGDVGLDFAALFVLAIAGFTFINGQSLMMHYKLVIVMSEEFRALNGAFPKLNEGLRRTAMNGRHRIVYWTHSFAFLGFLYLALARVGDLACAAGQGLVCLLPG